MIKDLKNWKELEPKKKERIIFILVFPPVILGILLFILSVIIDVFSGSEVHETNITASIDENKKKVFDTDLNEEKSIDVFSKKSEEKKIEEDKVKDKFFSNQTNTVETENEKNIKIEVKKEKKVIATKKSNNIKNETEAKETEVVENVKGGGLFVKGKNNTPSISEKKVKAMVMDSKNYRDGERIRIRVLEISENYNKNEIVYLRVTFNNDRIILKDDKKRNVKIYDHNDHLEGIKMNIDLNKIKADQELESGANTTTSELSSEVASGISSSAGIPIVGGIINTGINTGINVAKANVKRQSFEIYLEQGTFFYVE